MVLGGKRVILHTRYSLAARAWALGDDRGGYGDPEKRRNNLTKQSTRITLGVCVNCVEALGSLFYIIRMRKFRESTESVLTPRMAQ